ncbi:hypothetical protein HYPSUDRAFT_909259 [Hypholoma sublateritium FD-334 SS-4]|uniref:Uncharacterized protein n=1 Tax=Hypholoma sublateritium (strain FD-334 SS-4) TaxID=945553 RepID=A0A0D2NJF0_HYPSF|nr:hypothetical protein HYPSUDRAFT_909259 [Hypholoma sublateritium FD-334 SS-4]
MLNCSIWIFFGSTRYFLQRYRLRRSRLLIQVEYPPTLYLIGVVYLYNGVKRDHTQQKVSDAILPRTCSTSALRACHSCGTIRSTAGSLRFPHGITKLSRALSANVPCVEIEDAAVP